MKYSITVLVCTLCVACFVSGRLVGISEVLAQSPAPASDLSVSANPTSSGAYFAAAYYAPSTNTVTFDCPMNGVAPFGAMSCPASLTLPLGHVWNGSSWLNCSTVTTTLAGQPQTSCWFGFSFAAQ